MGRASRVWRRGGGRASVRVLAALAAGGTIVSLSLISQISLIDGIVLLGVAVVLPLTVGGPAWWWIGSAALVVASFLVPTGWAGLLVLPFLAVTIATLARTVSAGGQLFLWQRREVINSVVSVYAVVAAGALAQSRFGAQVFGIREPIVELTSVHYIFAGSAALVLAEAARTSTGGRWCRLAEAAVVSTAVAPPLVAAGFVTGAALPQVGGALLLTLGVWLTASVQLVAVVRTPRPVLTAVLLGTSGLAVWVPMVLAVAWAAGQHWDVPVLSIPDMARTHGLANALAFVTCGLLGRHLQEPVAVEGLMAARL